MKRVYRQTDAAIHRVFELTCQHDWDDAEHRAAIHQAFNAVCYVAEFGPKNNLKWRVRKLARLCANAEVRREAFKTAVPQRRWPPPLRRNTLPLCFEVVA